MKNPDEFKDKNTSIESMFRMLKNDERYCKKAFYTDDNDIIVKVRSRVTKKVMKYYQYELDRDDFGTVLYETLWKDGSWAPLDKYSSLGSVTSWLTTTAFRAVQKYLYEIGIIKDWKARTPENTETTLSNHTPEACRTFINDVMYDGFEHDLLIKIYVDRLPVEQIMECYHMDVKEFKRAQKNAEYAFRSMVLSQCYLYEDQVLTDKLERRGFCRGDEIWDKLSCADNSIDEFLGDMIGINLKKAEVQQQIVDFLISFTRKLKWKEKHIKIFILRYQEVPAKKVAEDVGDKPQNIDTTFHRLQERFKIAFKRWYDYNS